MNLLDEIGHRPYPPPSEPWIMYQRWLDLLFAHWPYPPEHIRKLLPPGLTLDTFDGKAWVGLVPFRIADLHVRSTPTLRGISDFPEINLRTYVVIDGRPGVFFWSLDAGSSFAVAGARIFYHLPYYRARFRLDHISDRIRYQSFRVHPGAPPAACTATYGPVGEPFKAEHHTLARWLTERYCLYASHRGKIYRAEIHHHQWPLQPATAVIDADSFFLAHGLPLPNGEPLLHFAARLDVIVWPSHRV